jgi:Ca-activated chloride channel family protein
MSRLARCVTVVSMLAAGFPQQVFRTGADAVLIDVLVTDGRKPIAGLTADDFELRDNGVVQRIAVVTMEDLPVNLMLVLDSSASMTGERLRQLKDAASGALSLLEPHERAALVGFSHHVRIVSDWTAARPALEAALEGLAAGGGTALYHAITFALGHRDQSPTRALALVFSDGMDSASAVSRDAVFDLARRSDVVLYAVALGEARQGAFVAPDYSSGIELRPPRDERALLDLVTEETGGRVLRIRSGTDLRGAFLNVLREFRSRYVLSYEPHGVASGGWHEVNVRVKKRRAEVVARRGYLR